MTKNNSLELSNSTSINLNSILLRFFLHEKVTSIEVYHRQTNAYPSKFWNETSRNMS